MTEGPYPVKIPLHKPQPKQSMKESNTDVINIYE